MSGTIEIKNQKKGARAVKALTRNQTRAKVDADTGILGAGKQMEKLEKRIEKLEKANSALTMTVGKLWKWKVETEMKDD